MASHDTAARAVVSFDAALALAPKNKAFARRRQLAVALQSESLAEAMVGYARFLLDDDPDGPYQIRNLAFLMPQTLGAAETAWLAAFLRQLAANRAGGNEALRQQLAADIKELLRPYR